VQSEKLPPLFFSLPFSFFGRWNRLPFHRSTSWLRFFPEAKLGAPFNWSGNAPLNASCVFPIEGSVSATMVFCLSRAPLIRGSKPFPPPKTMGPPDVASGAPLVFHHIDALSFFFSLVPYCPASDNDNVEAKSRLNV